MIQNKNRYNQWINAKGQRSFVYNNPRNSVRPFFVDQCRCDYNEDTHQVVLNYITNGWLDESKAQTQIKRWMKVNVPSSKCICTVENVSISKKYGKTARIQLVWLSDREPKTELMLNLEQRFQDLSNTAPIKEEEETDDYTYVKRYVKDIEHMKELIENGIL